MDQSARLPGTATTAALEASARGDETACTWPEYALSRCPTKHSAPSMVQAFTPDRMKTVPWARTATPAVEAEVSTAFRPEDGVEMKPRKVELGVTEREGDLVLLKRT